MTVPLLTSSWPTLLRYLADGDRLAFVPLGCSVGVPRSFPWARSLRASEITPYGLVGEAAKKLTPDQWEARYLGRLERHGVDRIQTRFNDVFETYGGKPLVLLCWEASPVECHRGMFARWWQEQTGQHVPEAHGLDPLSLLAALAETDL
jgi:hypothetical protein